MTQHLTMAELTAGLPEILASPADEGRVDMIISRPGHGQRTEPTDARLTAAAGVEGDHWSKGCWKSLDDGSPDPDVQICMMMSRCIDLIAGDRANWAPAGDNLFLDFDLTPANCPPGTRLAIGEVVLRITDVPHKGCKMFVERYGRDACAFVNVGPGDQYKLRGIYGRVEQDGVVRVGDTVRKL